MSVALETDLIPVRALNQASYCERLYYLQYVEAVMPTNEHVEDGLFEHRRVNDPDLEHRSKKDGDVVTTRSVALSSESLGITAKLDLLEETHGEMIPVEHKRSHAPRDEAGDHTFWENDAIQLCAQALLVEEAFETTIETGILYYHGSKARIEVALDTDLRNKTMATIARVRELATLEAPPEPLPAELRHQCNGCSLVTVCQPEETLYHIEKSRLPEAEQATPGITRVLPQSDAGAVVYLQEQGSHVGKRSEHLIVKKDGKQLNRIPLAHVRQVVVLGNVQISTQALQCLAFNEVPVMYLNCYGRFIAALQPAPAKNIALRQTQYQRFTNPEESLMLTKAVVKAKLTNQRTLLMRSLRGRSVEDADRTTQGGKEPAARDLATLIARVDHQERSESVMGLEGQGAALYFRDFGRFLKAQPPGRGFDFQHRNRRPPRDPVNCLLSLAYAMLAKDCFSALCTVGFDPYCGFFHAGRHGRPSLALDLMEEFRAVIADSVVLTMINNQVVVPEDFLVWNESCQMTDAGRKKFFRAYETRKATEVTHPIYGYRMTWSRMLEVQARMLAAYVRGDVPDYVGFTVR